MGLEFQIETYDVVRTELPGFLRRQPEFLREENGTIHLGPESDRVLCTVRDNQSGHVYVCQHVASREADALLGLIIRRLLSLNDHVVVSEL